MPSPSDVQAVGAARGSPLPRGTVEPVVVGGSFRPAPVTCEVRGSRWWLSGPSCPRRGHVMSAGARLAMASQLHWKVSEADGREVM